MTPPEKPPYRVPSMRAIEATEKNGLTLLSMFSGCGGSCLGFRMAGFTTRWALEFIPAAAEVYRLNHPGVPVETRDIRDACASEVLAAANLKEGECDLLEGSPPCASFSTCGSREKGWQQVKPYSDTKQRTDDLFFEYARLIDGIQPKVFVAENVAGLVRGVAKGYFKMIFAAFERCGYTVKAQVLDAQWLGVPQHRARVIYVGVREDLAARGFHPVFPEPLPYRYSLKEALDGIVTPEPTPEQLAELTFGGPPPAWFIETGEVFDTRYAIGREAEGMKEGASSDRYLNLQRASWHLSSPTVVQTGGARATNCVIHPTGMRKYSIPELKRVCAFPDDFQLTGSYEKQWERLGRAVPPVMMAAIARPIRDRILLPARDGAAA